MPIYEYRATEGGCEKCRECLALLRKMSDPPLERCPHCDAPVEKLVSRPAKPLPDILSKDYAQSKGFHKLVRKDKGVYEKEY